MIRTRLRPFFSLIPLLFFTVTACQQTYSGKRRPLAEKGRLNLSGWNFQTDGPATLDGEWEFYPNRLLDPSTISDSPRAKRSFITVPGHWDSYEMDGKPFPKHGFATYRTRLHLPSGRPEELALKMPEIGTAYRLYADGQLVDSAGTIGTTKEATLPRFKQGVVRVKPDEHGDLELVLQVSNFHHSWGGIWYSMQIGEEGQIHALREQKFYFEFFLFGSLFIMGLYHIALYLLRRRDYSPLLFGILSLMFAVRTLMVGGQYFLMIYPDVDFELYHKIGFILTYLLPVMMSAFLYSLFSAEHNKTILAFFSTFGSVLVLSVLFSDVTFYTGIVLVGYMVLMAAVTLHTLYVLVRAVRHRREGASVFTLGYLVMILSSVNDMLNAEGIIATGYFAEFGFFLFIFSQAFLLTQRFSKAFTAVENLSERLLVADRLKDEFLANTSHELRTPLNGIIGIADSILNGAAGQISDLMKTNLNLIVISGKRLSNLINDILDFSKLKNKEIELALKPVNLHDTVELVMALSHPLTAQKSLQLTNHVDETLPAAYADDNRLQQILLNLTGNAIKFTETGEVSVGARLIERPDAKRMIEVTVADSGIGIPEEKFDAIFRSFEQVDASTERTYGGTGLGLSITKHLVELHHGQIRVESKLGEGSRFIFTIPASDNPAHSETANRLTGIREVMEGEARDINHFDSNRNAPVPVASSTVDVVSSNGKSNSDVSILIVDDEPVNRQVLSNLLGLRQYTVLEAKNGEEALQILERRKPDLILLDIMMPRMNGYEVCRKLRETYPMSDLPVIILTAKNQLQDLMHGMNAGANDYLPKPFSGDELLIRMQTHLQLLNFNKAVGRFVPRDFLRQIEKNSILDVKLGDQVEKEITVLFSDIRNFTSLSERMSPRETFDFLIDYLEQMGPVIRNHNGFIDKYIGDSIMALFPHNATDAINASIDMRKKLAVYNEKRVGARLDPISIGIGINTGSLILGTIGDAERLEGTVIADAVNLASRLESLTKIYGAGMIISEHTLKKLDDPSRYHFRMLDRVQVVGKTESVTVYEIFDGESDAIMQLKLNTRNEFEQGIQHFTDGDFREAAAIFRNVLEQDPRDKTAIMHLKRCEYFAEYGVPPEWIGVSVMEHK